MEKKLKAYTLGEEVFNSVTHGVGAGISVAACVLMIIRAALTVGAIGVVSISIFGASLIVLYMMSTLYHAITNQKAKKVFQILDHCGIFFLIAGTYTPYCLVSIGGALGWTIFGIVWGSAALGITLNSINMERFKKLSIVLYLAMGWCVIFSITKVFRAVGLWGFVLLFSGGILYTVGIIFYKKKNIRYMHSIWHIFVVLASVCQILSVLFFVLK